MQRPTFKALSIIYMAFVAYLLVFFLFDDFHVSTYALLTGLSLLISCIPLAFPRANLYVIPVYSVTLFVVPLFLDISNLNLVVAILLTVSSLGLALSAGDLRKPFLVPLLVFLVVFGISYSVTGIILVESGVYSWFPFLAGIPLFISPVMKLIESKWNVIPALALVLVSQFMVTGSNLLNFSISTLLSVSSISITLWGGIAFLVSVIILALGGRRPVPLIFLALSGLVYLLGPIQLASLPLQIGSVSIAEGKEVKGLEVKAEGNKIVVRFPERGMKTTLLVDSLPQKFSCNNSECTSTIFTGPGAHEVKLCVAGECVTQNITVTHLASTPIRIEYSLNGNKLKIVVKVTGKVNSLDVTVNGDPVKLQENGKEYTGEYPISSPGKYVIEATATIRSNTVSVSREVEVESLNLEISLKIDQRWPDLVITAETLVDGSKSPVDKIRIKVNDEDISFSNPDTGVYTATLTSLEGKTYEVVVEAQKGEITRVERRKVTISPPLLSSWDPKIWIGKTVYGYDVEGVLGIGGTSFVLLGKRENRRYAIKIASVSPSSSSSSTRLGISTFSDLSKESSKLQEISERSNDIVKLYGVYADVNTIKEILEGKSYLYLTNPPAIIMELMTGGTAEDLVKKEAVFLSSNWPSVVKLIFTSTVRALSVVHRENYVHLDVKPRNIFFTEPPGNTGGEVLNNLIAGRTMVKLGDLGSARRRGERITEYTAEYCPVDQVEDMLLGRGARPDMDVFALGATIYRLINGTSLNPVEVVREMDGAVDAFLRRGDFRANLERAKRAYATVHSNLRLSRFHEVEGLVRKMTDPDPTERPSIQEVLNELMAIK
ncbi:Serine/threonine-protein kinase ArnS [Metallosphaera sp. J1]|uniref:protein kinase domain-containing protein n=1 Tax=Metallosphaera javensis (ex Hofmann et al. 2022) TaxID=99938 RepID=UPI001EE13791|nr:protein kinase [Metallosphaera javensis (ex Hofmann et al. 2022)]MCG3109816.1 Serine/threonine-protein kinase ArnS [Metallosphaera javensis (ex Hofmann et al. 2022)]